MKQDRAANIKNYIAQLFAGEDSVLVEVRKNAKRDGLPNIHISPNVGKLLHCLIKIHRPQRVLEIGTLAGYSAIWIARALPPTAKVISLEVNVLHAAIARKNLEVAGLQEKVEVKIGPAIDWMDKLIDLREPAFDLIFIDADKNNYPIYLEKAIALAHPGSLILSDNLIPREEKIGDPQIEDREAQAIYQFNRMIASHPRLESILIPTIAGHQGRIDALGLSFVKGEF